MIVFFQVCLQRSLQVYEHDGVAPLHPEDLPEMLRVRAIPDPAGWFVSSGIEKGFGDWLKQYIKKNYLSYSKLTYKEIMLSAQDKLILILFFQMGLPWLTAGIIAFRIMRVGLS